jgi:hypothetical protein
MKNFRALKKSPLGVLNTWFVLFFLFQSSFIFSQIDSVPAGLGTLERPYLIASPSNLVWMQNAVNSDSSSNWSQGKHFLQTANINLTGSGFNGIGSSTSGSEFQGTYDGGGYAITNLSLSGMGLHGRIYQWYQRLLGIQWFREFRLSVFVF